MLLLSRSTNPACKDAQFARACGFFNKRGAAHSWNLAGKSITASLDYSHLPSTAAEGYKARTKRFNGLKHI